MKLTRTLRIPLAAIGLGIFVLSLPAVPTSNWPHTSELLYYIVFYINELVYCHIVPYSMNDLKQCTSAQNIKKKWKTKQKKNVNIYRHLVMKFFIMCVFIFSVDDEYAAVRRFMCTVNIYIKRQFSICLKSYIFLVAVVIIATVVLCRAASFLFDCLLGLGFCVRIKEAKKKNQKWPTNHKKSYIRCNVQYTSTSTRTIIIVIILIIIASSGSRTTAAITKHYKFVCCDEICCKTMNINQILVCTFVSFSIFSCFSKNKNKKKRFAMNFVVKFIFAHFVWMKLNGELGFLTRPTKQKTCH